MKLLIAAVIFLLLGILCVVAYRVQTNKIKVVYQAAVPIYAKDAQGFQRPGATHRVTLSKDEWTDSGLWVKPSQSVSVVPASINEPFVLKIGDIEKEAVPGNGGYGDSEGAKRPAFGISLSVLPTNLASDSDDNVHTDTQEKILLKMSDKASRASIDVLVLIEDVKLKSSGEINQ
jgi:hypothetical protein